MTLLTLFPILQQSEDIRSVNSTWLLVALILLILIMGILGGWAKGGGGDDQGDNP